MDEYLETAVKTIQKRYNAEAQEFRGETTLLVNPELHVEAARTLRDEFEFNMLLDETAVDYYPQDNPRFQIVYHLYSMSHQQVLRVRVPVAAGSQSSIATLETVYPNANWKEREIWDLFGIHFEGHSDMRRIMMPDDWEGHPLRKDYPLGYEEVEFTFNFDEIDLTKPRGEL
ncbi:MAG: NADH-quinone oxidoreductase subunit C [Anaerolineaceae bacterium]|nr:NADH-quinone oxidoreductase subunit C [Anaerolineaceae bacterium]